NSKLNKFEEGQRVYLHVPQVKKGRVKKLSRPWKGPYTIVKVISDLNVVLRIKRKNVTVHVNRVKPVTEFKLQEQGSSQNDPKAAQVAEEEEQEEIIEETEDHEEAFNRVAGQNEEQDRREPSPGTAEERPGPFRSIRDRRKPCRFKDYEVY
ncbi:hypothetical protein J6590_091185, partial [Homalodisca vitripennis]